MISYRNTLQRLDLEQHVTLDCVSVNPQHGPELGSILSCVRQTPAPAWIPFLLQHPGHCDKSQVLFAPVACQIWSGVCREAVSTSIGLYQHPGLAVVGLLCCKSAPVTLLQVMVSTNTPLHRRITEYVCSSDTHRSSNEACAKQPACQPGNRWHNQPVIAIAICAI